ncbi:MAG: hypothetical protein ACREAW_01315, partial [Nitrososphaera sp.]
QGSDILTLELKQLALKMKRGLKTPVFTTEQISIANVVHPWRAMSLMIGRESSSPSCEGAR